jgi:hypothetical protein
MILTAVVVGMNADCGQTAGMLVAGPVQVTRFEIFFRTSSLALRSQPQYYPKKFRYNIKMGQAI